MVSGGWPRAGVWTARQQKPNDTERPVVGTPREQRMPTLIRTLDNSALCKPVAHGALVAAGGGRAHSERQRHGSARAAAKKALGSGGKAKARHAIAPRARAPPIDR